jgi:uncharacterized repeat protein (TIGR03803 family)
MAKDKLFPTLCGLLTAVTAFALLAPGAWAKPKYQLLAFVPGGLSGGLTFDPKGNLYGATIGGGANGVGSIFEMTRNSKGKWTLTTLHSFNGKDGSSPNGDLIFDTAGNLYGTTPVGGAYDGGTIFELSPGSGGWTFSVLYSFCKQYGCPDGGGPLAGLVQDKNGNLLGTARAGLYDLGVVFELTPGSNGWTYSVLYNFGSRPHDGSDPMDKLIIDAGGSLYGTTAEGGRYGYAAGDSTVFELTPTSGGGWKERLLWQFDGSDGGGPGTPVTIDSAGNIYGTTRGGGGTCDGDLCGTLFKLARRPGGRWVHSLAYGFLKPQDGFEPITGVAFDKTGNLYGTAASGGTGSCYDGCGVVYKLAPRADGKWKYTVLYRFLNPSESPPDGRLIIDSKGNLYGTAFSIVYEITP